MMIERMFLYNRGGRGDAARKISAREADTDFRDTDAGFTLSKYPVFIVLASSQEAALDGARRWLACWADENEQFVPDDLALEEREYRPGKTYMTLRVL